MLGVGVTISAGTWIAGVPTLVRDTLGHGAGGFSLVMVGYAVGSIAGGVALARMPVRRKALASMLAWTLYLPAYGLIGVGGTLGVAIAGAPSRRARPELVHRAAHGGRPGGRPRRAPRPRMGLISSSTAARTRPG